MNNKERKAILEEFKSLQDFLNNNKEVAFLHPNVVTQIRNSYKEVMYDRVDKKDNGVTLYGNKIEDIATFVGNVSTSIEQGKNLFKTGEDKAVLVAELQASPIPKLFNLSDSIFQSIEFEVQNVFDNLSGTYVTQEELYKELHHVIGSTYTNLDAPSIKKCKNIITIKKLGIDLINTFIKDYKQKYKSGDHGNFGDSFQTLADELDEFFEEKVVLTQVEAGMQVEAWTQNAINQLKVLNKDTYANAPVQTRLFANELAAQIAAVNEEGIKTYLNVLATALAALEDGASLTDIADQMAGILPTVALPSLTPTQLQALSSEPKYIQEKLASHIKLNSALLSAVDVNSADFIVNQDDFQTNLKKELNEWKSELSTALAEAADLILKLDGCTINGTQFLSGLLDCSKIDSVTNLLKSLQFGEMKLRKHKDLSQFEEEWGKPWTTAISTIDIEKDIIEILGNDSQKLSNLYQNLPAYLPTKDHVIATLNLCIGGKINLALEAVGKLKKEVDKINEEVIQIKEVNDLQTLALGYNSIMNEIDLVFKSIMSAHKDYAHRVNLYCLEYNTAYEQVDVAVEDFNKASEAIQAFRDAIFGAISGVVTTALAATGAGLLIKAGAELTKQVAIATTRAVITAVAKPGVDAATGSLSEAMLGSMPSISNSTTTPFAEYLSKQIQGEQEVVVVLKEVLELSKVIQGLNAEIQKLLESGGQSEDTASILESYNKYSKDLATWLGKQKGNINKFNAETAQLQPQPNTTCKNIEHNMYIEIIDAQLGDKVDSNSWQTICNATVFRGRLEGLGLISGSDFIDNWGYDRGTDKELKRLYNKKAIPLF